jgi:hypothetical protein
MTDGVKNLLEEVEILKSDAINEMSTAEKIEDIFRLQGKIQAYGMVIHAQDQLEMDKKSAENT